MDPQERQQFAAALARKRAEAQARARDGGPPHGAGRPDADADAHGRAGTQRTDPRAKNSRHGQVTADKWNQ